MLAQLTPDERASFVESVRRICDTHSARAPRGHGIAQTATFGRALGHPGSDATPHTSLQTHTAQTAQHRVPPASQVPRNERDAELLEKLQEIRTVIDLTE